MPPRQLSTDSSFNHPKDTQLQIETLYLDWLNNFVIINKFAKHHGLSVEFAVALIKEGQRLLDTSLALQE